MQNYIVRVYRTRPEDMESVSGVIENIESGQKESFNTIDELQTILAHSIGKGQLGFPDMVARELNTQGNIALAG
jgi:hypothetical protein